MNPFTGEDRCLLSHLNTPDGERAAAGTFKRVEIALWVFCLYSEQTHFHVAIRADQQRLDQRSRGRVPLRKRVSSVHSMCLSYVSANWT